MPELKKPVLLGIIGAAHGIKGEVRVKSFTHDIKALGDYGPLYDEEGRKFKVKRLRQQKAMLVVKFEGINTRDEAEAVNGRELFVERDRLPNDTDEDEFYITDLIGCDVYDKADGAYLGCVMAVPNFGADDLLEIGEANERSNVDSGLSERTFYLPFSKENVPDIDFEKWAVHVKLPKEVSERDEDETT